VQFEVVPEHWAQLFVQAWHSSFSPTVPLGQLDPQVLLLEFKNNPLLHDVQSVPVPPEHVLQLGLHTVHWRDTISKYWLEAQLVDTQV
jgi:hypothetical protein